MATSAELAYSSVMISAAPYLFGIVLDVRAAKPRPFSQRSLEEILTRLVDTEQGLALKSEQVRLRQLDAGFEYEVKASLLNGNGVFIYDAEKSAVSISGGRTPADVKLLAEAAKRFLWTINVAAEDVGTLSVNTHARAESSDARTAFLRRFAEDDRIVAPGTLGYVRVEDWDTDVRFSVEQSIGVPDSLFVAWSTQFQGAQWIDTVDHLTGMLESVAAVFGIQFEPVGEI